MRINNSNINAFEWSKLYQQIQYSSTHAGSNHSATGSLRSMSSPMRTTYDGCLGEMAPARK